MTRIYTIIISLLTALGATFSASGADVSVKTLLDSAYIIMGKQTALHLEIIEPDGVEGQIVLPDTAWRVVEIASQGQLDTASMGNGRRQILGDIILQSFDSGLYTLPPVLYIAGGETIASNRPVLKVMPVAVDTMVTVHDYAGVSDIDRSIFDYLPDWMTDYGVWILLIIVLIAGGAFVYFKWLRKGRLPLVPAKKPVPPYELAVQELIKLKGQKLCEQGLEKEYYTRLTDILRTYLESRFGINAMEMTSTQILHVLNENEQTRLPRKYMSEILNVADFVKFAKVRPLPDDNIKAYNSAMQFVEDTKPQPEAVNDAAADEKSGAQSDDKSSENPGVSSTTPQRK